MDLNAKKCVEPNHNAREPQGAHRYSRAQCLVPVQFELPRINPRYYTGKPYRYIYVVRATPGQLFNALLKIDV